MSRHLGLWIVCWLSVATVVTAQNLASLKTAETKLRFEAGLHTPRLSSLQNGTEVLENRSIRTLVQSVEIGGESLPVVWNFNASESRSDNKIVSFIYDSDSPRLRLTWEWGVRSEHGPIEHQVRIENRDSGEVLLPAQNSFTFDFKILPTDAFEQLYVEKGADTPSGIGTHLDQIGDGYRWEGYSSTYAQARPGDPREIIPYTLVERSLGVQTGFYVGIEFSGRTHMTVARTSDSLRGEVGLNPEEGEFRTRLKPGEVFETPRIFLGSTHGGPDATANVLRHWIREVLVNQDAWKNPAYPLTAYNTWSVGTDVNEDVVRHMISDSSELGIELFDLDAGWFRDVGDWQPDPVKFPHGLQPVVDEAHARGMKFGLWLDWAQAGLGTSPGALNVRNPKTRGWLTTELAPNWRPEELKGGPIDIGDPPAKAWVMRETERIVNDYKLDVLEHDGYLVAQGCESHDHTHLPPNPLNKATYINAGYGFARSSNSTDVSYHATRAYYDIQSNLRQKHPGLLLEVRNDGGRMIDFGSAANGDYFSMTDTYDPLSNRRAFYDASFIFPPAMLESFVESWPLSSPSRKLPSLENFRYMLRSGMMGWFSLMIDTTTWHAEHYKIAKEEIQLYKSQLRPLIREADLYHVSGRPDAVNWDGMEYFDPQTRRGIVYAFRGATSEAMHRFPIRGVDPESKYQVRFHDHSASDQVVDGDELLNTGLLVKLLIPTSSEIVFLEELPRH
jgi:alpha-galactosidase